MPKRQSLSSISGPFSGQIRMRQSSSFLFLVVSPIWNSNVVCIECVSNLVALIRSILFHLSHYSCFGYQQIEEHVNLKFRITSIDGTQNSLGSISHQKVFDANITSKSMSKSFVDG